MEPMEVDTFGAKLARFLAFVIAAAIFIAFMSGGLGGSGSEMAGGSNPYRGAIPVAPTATPQERSSAPAHSMTGGCTPQMIFWGCQPAGSAAEVEP